MYRNVPGVGRVATKELKDYRKLCSQFEIANSKTFNEIKDSIRKDAGLFEHLKVDYFFMFKRERLYTKDGRPKRLDVANRIKAVQDCFFHSLGIDDKHVFCSMIEKISGENESVTIVLHPHEPITALELLDTFEGVPPILPS